MSTYEVSELLQQWKNGTIDTPQTIGHILQHLVVMQRQVEHTHGTSELAAEVGD